MFRFTIRDLLWLMVVVAILSLWAIERQGTNLVDYWYRTNSYQAELLNRIKKLEESTHAMDQAWQNERELRRRAEAGSLSELSK